MEIEAVLYQHPSIIEACVVGVNKSDKTKIMAFMVIKPSSDMKRGEILSFASKRLSQDKLPDEMIFMESLPKSISNKIDRKAIQELANAGIHPLESGS